MWKWFLFKDAKVGFLYIASFTIGTLALIHVIDFAWRKLRKKK